MELKSVDDIGLRLQGEIALSDALLSLFKQDISVYAVTSGSATAPTSNNPSLFPKEELGASIEQPRSSISKPSIPQS
jgi:hypothetical protein